jgi:hypothetical protein
MILCVLDDASMAETGAITAAKIIMIVDYDYYFFNLKSDQLSRELMWTCETPD